MSSSPKDNAHGFGLLYAFRVTAGTASEAKGGGMLEVLDSASVASGPDNEDRVGSAHAAAWVIDGATDALDAPLTSAASDAAWFAAALNDELSRRSAELPGRLADLPAMVASDLARKFASAARRAPAERFEHPSASGLVVRRTAVGLDYVSVGDCTLIVADGGSVARYGVTPKEAGDTALGAAIREFQERSPTATAAQSRAHVWPRVRATRQLMNSEAGYGVFSITPPPPRFVQAGSIPVPPGTLLLLASDGLLRLVDVYRVMDARQLVTSARRDGLEALISRLRAIEADDADCRRFPRAKPTDDASGLLLALA